MIKLKITQIGNSLGVILPKEALARLSVDKGDEVVLSETIGGYSMTPGGSPAAEQLEKAKEIMKRRRAVLRELSK
jgi:putative addiction module antidote